MIAGCFLASSQSYANDQKVLGFITLGQTSYEEITSYLDEHQCSYATTKAGFVVNGCWNLPNLQKTTFIFKNNIELVMLEFDKGGPGNDIFETYFNALNKTWGKPIHYENPFVGDKSAEWSTSITI